MAIKENENMDKNVRTEIEMTEKFEITTKIEITLKFGMAVKIQIGTTLAIIWSIRECLTYLCMK